MIRYDTARLKPPYYPIIESSINVIGHQIYVELTTRLRKKDTWGLWRDVYFIKTMTIQDREKITQAEAVEMIHKQFHIEIYGFITSGKIEHPVLSDIGSMFPESDTQEPEEDRLRNLFNPKI